MARASPRLPSSSAQGAVGALRATQEDAVPHDVEASAERIQHQHQRGQANEILRVARVEHPVVQDRHVSGSRQRHQVDCGRAPEDRRQQAAAACNAQCGQEKGRPFSPLPFTYAPPQGTAGRSLPTFAGRRVRLSSCYLKLKQMPGSRSSDRLSYSPQRHAQTLQASVTPQGVSKKRVYWVSLIHIHLA